MVGPKAIIYHARPAENLKRQLDYLAGLPKLSLEDALSGKPGVLITIDDGWAWLLEVWGWFKDRGLKPVLFLATILPELRERGSWEKFVRGRFPRMAEEGLVPLSWDELKDLVKEGLVVQSHTHSHVRVSRETPPEELEFPKRLIEEHLGQRVWALAYPYGRAKDVGTGAGEALGRAGYTLGFTARCGFLRGDPFYLPRCYADERWPVKRLRKVLERKFHPLEWLRWRLKI